MTSVKQQNDILSEWKCILYCQGVIKEVAKIMSKHERKWNNLLVLCSLFKNLTSLSLMNEWFPGYSGFSSSASLTSVCYSQFVLVWVKVKAGWV